MSRVRRCRQQKAKQHVKAPDPRHNFRQGFWRLADPKISLASVASMFLGAAVAASHGPIHWGWLAVTVVGIFALEVAKNASGEIFDFDSGTDLRVDAADRSPFSGGKRVLVDGLLTRCETWAIALGGYVLGAAAGFWIVFAREPRVLWIGLVGLACAYFYHAPPFKLSYRGLGELAVGVCYGPLIATGTYLVQRGRVAFEVVWSGVSLGLLITAFLWINEFPDSVADSASGKRTWVVRLGRERASQVLALGLELSFLLLFALPMFGFSPGLFGGLIGGPAAVAAARLAKRHFADTPRLIPAQVRTLQAFVLMALGSGVGVILAAKLAAGSGVR